MRHTAIALCGALLLFFASGTVHADLITSASDPALDGSTVIDFDDNESGTVGDTFSVGNVAWNDLDEESAWWYSDLSFSPAWDGYWGMSEQSLRCSSGELEIEFTSPVSAFGLNYGGHSSTWYVYDEDDVLIETFSVDRAKPFPYPEYFVGASGERIKRVVCIADDLSYLPGIDRHRQLRVRPGTYERPAHRERRRGRARLSLRRRGALGRRLVGPRRRHPLGVRLDH